MPLVTRDFEEYAVHRGKVWRTDVASGSISAAAAYYYGVTTGAQELVIYNRKYSSTTPQFRAALYETTWTGGTATQTSNRRLASTTPVPFTLKTGVTPGALGTAIFSATVRAGVATGNAQAAFAESTDAVILKANTSYVVALENLGSGIAAIDTTFDMRTTENLPSFGEFGG